MKKVKSVQLNAYEKDHFNNLQLNYTYVYTCVCSLYFYALSLYLRTKDGTAQVLM